MLWMKKIRLKKTMGHSWRLGLKRLCLFHAEMQVRSLMNFLMNSLLQDRRPLCDLAGSFEEQAAAFLACLNIEAEKNGMAGPDAANIIKAGSLGDGCY